MKKNDWICTDLDENQYGRQLTPICFEFRDNEIESAIIRIGQYDINKIENIINAYGYTLFESKSGLENIVLQYGHTARWIIAECIFEMREF